MHKAKKCLDIFEESGAKVVFIPSYTLLLVSIELIFNVLKRFLSRQSKNKTTILSKQEGLREIKEARPVIKISMVFRTFRNFLMILSMLIKSKNIESQYKNSSIEIFKLVILLILYYL